MKPRILWVDDEPFILSAVKRLLELNKFEVVTCQNPHEVEGLLNSNAFHILVSDQRMPQMTGIELLTSIKEKYPLLTRLMVTGFSDKDLLEEAVNKAGVYRFISKPWDEQELLSDLKSSYEHHLQKVKNLKLTQEIKIQNRTLVELTNNLEGIVLNRTQEIQKSNLEIETRGKSIQELARFTEKIHEIGNFKDLINFISKDLKTYFEAASPLLFVETAQKVNNIYFLVKKNVRATKVKKYFENHSEIRFNDERDRLKLIEILKRPMSKMITLPLLSFRKESQGNSILFIEHELQDVVSEKLIDYLTSRIQILSIAVDRILSHEKLEFESQKWEDTYDSLEEPLCILDDYGTVIRSNESYDTEIQHIYGDELAKLSQTGLLNVRRGSKIYDTHFYKINFENSSSHAIVYFRDITQERLLYQSLVQTEKMSALGLLAGNIAHELNNPLTGIRSLAQILIQEVKNPSYLSDLTEIEKATQRCQNVIKELQEFSTKGDIEKRERVDLHKLIHKTLTFLKTALRSHNLDLNFKEEACVVLASPQILQQIIFNIIINACQAMENSGTIEIRTKVVKPMVQIDIQDFGPGIPTAARPFVFDPFFTTKKDGEGTGIGLSFCKSMTEKMGGKISFISEIGKGTTFTLELPLA